MRLSAILECGLPFMAHLTHLGFVKGRRYPAGVAVEYLSEDIRTNPGRTVHRKRLHVASLLRCVGAEIQRDSVRGRFRCPDGDGHFDGCFERVRGVDLGFGSDLVVGCWNVNIPTVFWGRWVGRSRLCEDVFWQPRSWGWRDASEAERVV